MALALTLLAAAAQTTRLRRTACGHARAHPTPERYTPEVLTGLKQGEDYPKNQRFACVMVNNISDGRLPERPPAGRPF